MTDKTFRVRRGQQVDLHLPPGNREGEGKGKGGHGKKHSVGADDDPDAIYAFRRKQSGLRIFDLSTRLRSVPTVAWSDRRRREYPTTDSTSPQPDFSDEYVFIPFEVHGVHTSTFTGVDDIFRPYHHQWYPTIQMNQAEWQRLDSMLLGGLKIVTAGQPIADSVDPTSFSLANGSSRTLPHCEETGSPIKIGGVWLDFEGWTPREPQESDDNEHWIDPPPASTNFPLKAPKTFKGKSGAVEMYYWGFGLNFWGEPDSLANIDDDPNAKAFFERDGRVLIQGRNYFVPLVTNSPYVKITETASFDAPAKTYSFSGDDNRFYLRPLLAGYRITSQPSMQPGPNLFPEDFVIPKAYFIGNRGNAGNYCTSEFIPRPLAPDAWMHTCSINIDPIPEDAHSFNASNAFGKAMAQGSLIAIIAQKARRYFVWAAVDLWVGGGDNASAGAQFQQYVPVGCE